MANNYIDEATFVAVIWVCLTITFFFLLAQLLLQYQIDRKWRTNDVLLLAAWLLFLGNCIVWSVCHKQMFLVSTFTTGAIDYATLPPNIASVMERYLRGQLAGYLSYTSLWLVKLSFVFFFRHLGNRFRAQRILWWVVLAFVISCYAVTLGVLDYACEMASFEESLELCASAHSVWYERVSLKISTSMDIVSDAAIIVLSGNVIWRVKINLWKKLALIGVSFLTAFIIITALVRLLLSVSGTGILSAAWLVFWNAIEICVAIMMACLASFWTFYTKLKRSARDLPGRGGLFSPPRDYASLERPILMTGSLHGGDKHAQSAVSVQSHISM
ncbi:hypothetical protein P170DRAFT_451345 [Aspergillus steynii IBT 23096]|uniref:Rhodopsin domain-containing protein n=1 Tax=Aspergillus steynii IBT 23096 TaxID=1392250 RepID=A0A2I2FRM7_9EURO|nr:uncharacterized protein P170DRAFT_451345 [Aspergillus steynii IBT 23096]PLB43283.1 hypothetical protein P170DRAFT_451345 [Aspergillus steynii IBT 23096]